MAALDPYLARKADVLAARRADFTADPARAVVRLTAASWVAGNTGARPVRLGQTTWITDSAPALAGHALGPTAPEMLLGALASCLVHTFLIEAVLLDVPLDAVEVTVQGALDMGGVVGLKDYALPRLEQVSYSAAIQTPAGEDAIARLHAAVDSACPVLNTLRLPVEVVRTQALVT